MQTPNPNLYPQIDPAPQNQQQYVSQYPQQYPPQYSIYQQPMVNANVLPPGYVPQNELQINSKGNPIGSPFAVYNPAQALLPRRTGLDKLNALDGIFVKQKLELFETIIGCETQNQYNVYALDTKGEGKAGRHIFKCQEKSNLCARWCLAGNCRPFEMNIYTVNEDGNNEPFLHLERPCRFTCLCFNRPDIAVTLVESGRNEYLGKIQDPWNCCNLELDIYDKDNAMKYIIYGSCCQIGLCCPCPIGGCKYVDFDVKTPSGDVVSHLQKINKSCLKSTFTDADYFALTFPKNVTTSEKALLMTAVVFLDFQHFEQNPQNN